MLAEREVLVSLLNVTREGPAKIKDVSRDAQVPLETVREVLEKNSVSGIIRMERELLEVDGEQRLKIALRSIALGADLERVCRSLTWGEFEDIAVLAFEANDFSVKKHFWFSWSGRRWEIDVLALKEPIVACVDCKQWRRGWRGSASRKAVEQQIERSRVLAEAAQSLSGRVNVMGWKQILLVPIILSLVPGALKFFRKAPVVPVLQLRDFLHQMPTYIGELTHFRVSASTGQGL